MIKRKWFFSVGALLFAISAQAEAVHHFTPGKWQYTVDYDLIGLPQVFPTYTLTHCLSADAPIPPIERSGHECTTHLQGRFGNTMTWVLNCHSEWEMVQGMGRAHFLPNNTFHGTVHVQIMGPNNPPQPMVFRMSGIRIGECEEQTED